MVNKETSQMSEWMNDFGNNYVDRNCSSLSELNSLYQNNYNVTRTMLNEEFLSGLDKNIRILEVGSNVGAQLLCLQDMGFKNLFGIEINKYAIEKSKENTKDINIIFGSAFDVPYKTGFFDLVYTSGVLIHISPSDIKAALKEIYRCSSQYIWGFEYYANSYEEVNYRGNDGLLWKTDFAALYKSVFEDLELVKEKKVKYCNDENIDNMYLLEKKA
ncbi:MAG: methyltransferase domain-containing protein [Planctomycetes bacterium]|nr:methyltransferase domain-containing protein [Planctomycetota bacterium]